MATFSAVDAYVDRYGPRLERYSHLAIPAAVLGIILVMIVPLPAFLLDLLIASDLAVSLLVLITATYLLRPVQFSVFPSLLLLVTLYRLALNVAATRRILLSSGGTDAAGKVIEAFGQFVVGGNFIVGIVVFLVLLAIQYVVINHGAVRISEVTARFTLDGMPGKQMAIDAELNAGILTEKQARERREEVAREAEFYGAMDGAIRFTQRDAVAAVIITLINIVAGFLIGVFQHGLTIAESAKVYTILTIGDGLVTAIPALLISVAGGVVVTRAASRATLGEDVTSQLFLNPRPLALGGGMLFAMALIPGLPKVSFFLLSMLLGGAGYVAYRKSFKPALSPVQGEAPAASPERVENLLKVDPLALEIGYGLIPLADEGQGGELLPRLRSLRRQIATELGFVVPHIRVLDNLQVDSRAYVVLLRGAEIARGTLQPGQFLAMDPGGGHEPLAGTPTREPAFGLPAWWIPAAERERAQAVGYTVVDPATVLATHLGELVRRYAHELLGRQETRALLDVVAESHPKLVDELIPKQLSLGEVQRVLQNLLRERVSIRDLPAILDALGDQATAGRDVVDLTEAARQVLGRTICRSLLNEQGELPAITLAPDLERELAAGLLRTDKGTRLALAPSELQVFVSRLSAALSGAVPTTTAAVVCGSSLRPHLSRLIGRVLPQLPVLSREEIPPTVAVRSLAQVTP